LIGPAKLGTLAINDSEPGYPPLAKRESQGGDAMDRPKTEIVDCDILIAGRGMSGCATTVWRPHAVAEGGAFRGCHAIGPCVDNDWLTLG